MRVRRAELPCAFPGCGHVEGAHCVNDYPYEQSKWYPMCVECMLNGRPDEHEFAMPELPLWVRDVAVLV